MPMKDLSRAGLAMLFGGLAASATLPVLAADMNLRGRFHLDAAVYDEDRVPLSNGFTNRRTRIGVSGSLNDTWSGQIEYDFGENGVSANDVWLQRSFGPGSLRIGQFKVPMGLNELTSSNNMTFIERASNSNIVADSRRLGVGYDVSNGPMIFQTMVYGRSIGGRQDGDMPIGAAARFVMAPRIAGDALLHLGISAAYEDRQDYTTLRFRDRPEARPDGNRLIDTGNVTDVDSSFKVGLEFAVQKGPVSAEAEYLRVDVDSGSGSPTFDGFHVQGSYVLTGESRGYRGGVFRGVTPSNPGRGAWEVAARYSSVDLIDGTFAGGEQNNVTIGLNYYATSNVRFMLNLIRVDVEDSNAMVGGVVVGDDSPNILLLRAQFNF